MLTSGASSEPESADAQDLLPVRMLNEFAYCPRLFHLMHVEGRWADNAFTVDGRHAHRRVDKVDQLLPDAEGVGQDGDGPRASRDDGDDPPTVVRSVPLSSPRLGLTAKLDLVAADGKHAVPVDTKRGAAPKNEQRSWEPERVQLMAQGLLLREHGYDCDRGVLYFASSKTRVDVPFTDELQARTLQLIAEARAAATRTTLPPPLDDSPKCGGCSLNGICLPDETLTLQAVPPDVATPEIRRMYPMRDEALPLYVQEQGASVGKSGDNLVVRKKGEKLAQARLKDVSQLVLCGNVTLSAQTVHLLCEAGVPIVYLSTGHWFYGMTTGAGLRNAYDRAAQFAAAGDAAKCLAFARETVAGKALNQRTLLRRNGSQLGRTLDDMADLVPRARAADSIESLLGLEGAVAAHYFAQFSSLLRPRDFDAQFDFAQRNRRPPRDPVNALLSFGYAMLTKECTVALASEGLDPYWGLYHRPRHGRPALALDLMEPFRPLIVDSAVVTAINTGMVAVNDFETAASGCMLKPAGRKAFIRAYEARLDQLLTHPVFDYRCSWRAALRLEARLLARWLRGDVPQYTVPVTR